MRSFEQALAVPSLEDAPMIGVRLSSACSGSALEALGPVGRRRWIRSRVGGLRIAFERVGEGPPLLLLHGGAVLRYGYR